MKFDQNVSRPHSARMLLLILAATLMAISYFAFSAPPRRTGPRRPPAAGRPRPAHRPGRHHAPARPGTVAHPKRIGTLQPVVLGGGGTVVVDGSSGSDDVQVIAIPVETPSNTVSTGETEEEKTPVSPGETLHADKSTVPSGGSSGVPSDADKSMTDSPSYKVVSVEDNGLTIVVDVDGQETKVRMIGLAEPQDNANDQDDSSRRPKGPGSRIGNRGGPGRGAPRLPTDIFLRNLLQGEEVYIVYDSMVEEQDEDGKYVAYVYRAPDGMLLNTEVLRQGFSVVDPNYDFTEKDTFLYYQDKAQKAQKGLWNKSRGPGRNGKPIRQGSMGKPDGMRK